MDRVAEHPSLLVRFHVELVQVDAAFPSRRARTEAVDAREAHAEGILAWRKCMAISRICVDHYRLCAALRSRQEGAASKPVLRIL